jgi:hypothetical protein
MSQAASSLIPVEKVLTGHLRVDFLIGAGGSASGRKQRELRSNVVENAPRTLSSCRTLPLDEA